MRRTALVLLSLSALLGAGLGPTPRARADCHGVDPAAKALRKTTGSLVKTMAARVRTAIANLKKGSKALATQVRKKTVVPDEAFHFFLDLALDTYVETVDAVDEAHDYSLQAYIAATAAAAGDLTLAREIDPGFGGAADLLHERTRDCMETVQDALGCNGAFKPLQAALHCEEFDVNWQALGPGEPRHLKQIQQQGGATEPVFRPGAPVVAAANCTGEIQVLVPSKGSEYSVAVYDASAGANANPVAEIAMPDPPGELFLASFEGLPPGDYRCYVVTETEEYILFVNGVDFVNLEPVCLATVPDWEEASAPVCTETSVTATWNSTPVAVGPLSAINVTKNAAGDITFVLATFESSGEAGSLWVNWTLGTPVDPSTTVYSKQPGDTLNVGGTVYNNSFIVDVATITNIGNLLITSPGSAAGIHVTGTGFHPSDAPSVIDVCAAGVDANVTTGP